MVNKTVNKHIGEGWRFRKTLSTKGGQLRSAAQYCNECGTKLKVIFKGTSDPDTWFWAHECDGCGDPICSNCSDVSSDGEVSCITCLSNQHQTQERKVE